MDPENIQTPSPDVEPPTVATIDAPFDVSQSTEQQAMPRELTTPVEVVPAVSQTSVVPPPKKRHKLRAALIIVAAIMVAAGIGLLIFYLAFRTPNSEYDALVRDLKSMREDAKIIPKADQTTIDDSYSMYSDATRRDAAENYLKKLNQIKQMSVFSSDSDIQKIYESDKAVFEEYGQTSVELFDTAVIYQEVTTKCNSALEGLPGSATVEEFDLRVASCELAIVKNPHVPRKPFDEAYYVYLLDTYEDIIDAYRVGYGAIEANDRVTLAAMSVAIDLAFEKYKALTASKPTLSNTKNPTYILDDMIKTAEQRKEVLFRP